MKHLEKLKDFITELNGIVLTKQVTKSGIPRTYIVELVKKGELERVGRGQYVTRDSYDDEMYRLQAKYNCAIFSHGSALFLNDLTDRDPIHDSVTVPAGYNYQNLRAIGIKVYSIKKDLYGLGLTTVKTIFGREIKCYNMERTVCDCIRSRNQMDIAIVTDAIKRYSKRKDKNLPVLMRYAENFKITKRLRSYLEVLL